jgi:hypothetical protein
MKRVGWEDEDERRLFPEGLLGLGDQARSRLSIEEHPIAHVLRRLRHFP